GGPLWNYLQGAGKTSREYLAYLPQGVRPWHCLDFQGDFASYLKTISSTARYKIRKHERDLRKRGGTLDCVRVASEDQVDGFLDPAAQVGQGSWQQRVLGTRVAATLKQQERLRFLAQRGILRSYLLRCGAQPCAFVIGYQFQGVYHHAEIGYDQALAKHTP